MRVGSTGSSGVGTGPERVREHLRVTMGTGDRRGTHETVRHCVYTTRIGRRLVPSDAPIETPRTNQRGGRPEAGHTLGTAGGRGIARRKLVRIFL